MDSEEDRSIDDIKRDAWRNVVANADCEEKLWRLIALFKCLVDNNYDPANNKEFVDEMRERCKDQLAFLQRRKDAEGLEEPVVLEEPASKEEVEVTKNERQSGLFNVREDE